MRNSNFLPILFCLILLVVSAGAAGLDSGLIGQKAPPISIDRWVTESPPGMDKGQVRSKIFVIDFWAVWCVPCKKSIPHMIKLAEEYGKKGVLFVGLSEDRQVEPVKKMIAEMGINYYVAMDKNTARNFSVTGLPTVFVIDHTSRVFWYGHPMDSQFEIAIKKALEAVPPDFLEGIELGPFEHLREQLSGGTYFYRAYRTLKLAAEDKDSPEQPAAKQIKEQIDARIQGKAGEAEKLREKEPLAAYRIYKHIIENYGGADGILSISEEYERLRNDPKVKKELEAIRILQNVERKFSGFIGCPDCKQFNPNCQKCLELNKFRLTFIRKELKTICEDYSGTDAAERAMKILDIFKTSF